MTDLLLQNSILYVVTLDDELLGLDVATGHLLWKFSSGASNEDFFTNSSPALFGHRVIFGALDGTVYALDAASGAVVWKQPLSYRISTSIAVFGASGYVGPIAGRLYRLDLTTGAVSAGVPLDGRAEGKLTVCGKSLLGYLGNQGLFGLEEQDKKIRWTQLAAKEWTSARPYCSGESVLVGDDDTLTVFRVSDGTPLGTRKFPGIIRGIGIDKEMFYVGTLKGTVYAYRGDF